MGGSFAVSTVETHDDSELWNGHRIDLSTATPLPRPPTAGSYRRPEFHVSLLNTPAPTSVDPAYLVFRGQCDSL